MCRYVGVELAARYSLVTEDLSPPHFACPSPLSRPTQLVPTVTALPRPQIPRLVPWKSSLCTITGLSRSPHPLQAGFAPLLPHPLPLRECSTGCMHSTAQSLLPKISSAPAIRDLTSARVRPPRLLWTERLVFPARCCIHECAAGTGVQTTRLAPRLPACLSSGAPPQQRHRREGNHTQLNGPFALYRIRTARCRGIIPLFDTSMATASARGGKDDLRRTLIGALQDARAPIVECFHKPLWVARGENKQSGQRALGSGISALSLLRLVYTPPFTESRPPRPQRYGSLALPFLLLYYLPSFAPLWRMGRSLRVRGTINATAYTTLAPPALRRQGVRPTSGATLPLQRRRITLDDTSSPCTVPLCTIPPRRGFGVPETAHCFARETRREVRAVRGGRAPHRRCTTQPEHPLYWQIAFLGPGNGMRAFQRLVGVDGASRSSEMGSLYVAPKSKPPSSGSFYPTLSCPPPLPNVTELAVESLAFTPPDLHALSSVSQQYHPVLLIAVVLGRKSREALPSPRHSLLVVYPPAHLHGALFRHPPPLPLLCLFAGIRPSLAVESVDVRPQVMLHASSAHLAAFLLSMRHNRRACWTTGGEGRCAKVPLRTHRPLPPVPDVDGPLTPGLLQAYCAPPTSSTLHAPLAVIFPFSASRVSPFRLAAALPHCPRDAGGCEYKVRAAKSTTSKPAAVPAYSMQLGDPAPRLYPPRRPRASTPAVGSRLRRPKSIEVAGDHIGWVVPARRHSPLVHTPLAPLHEDPSQSSSVRFSRWYPPVPRALLPGYPRRERDWLDPCIVRGSTHLNSVRKRLVWSVHKSRDVNRMPPRTVREWVDAEGGARPFRVASLTRQNLSPAFFAPRDTRVKCATIVSPHLVSICWLGRFVPALSLIATSALNFIQDLVHSRAQGNGSARCSAIQRIFGSAYVRFLDPHLSVAGSMASNASSGVEQEALNVLSLVVATTLEESGLFRVYCIDEVAVEEPL
ncbi:hypothetical protein B0H13DRAFT_2530029 [Mycena leptocephala]|nr:hypothetical protein B0H13DRAFT_2530029 [Mycena leptocephala]